MQNTPGTVRQLGFDGPAGELTAPPDSIAGFGEGTLGQERETIKGMEKGE